LKQGRHQRGDAARRSCRHGATVRRSPTRSETSQERQIELFRQVHPDFGAEVCAALDALDPQF